jgi:hypothetical protein
MSFLPPREAEYLKNKGYTYVEAEQGGQKGLVIQGMTLPQGRYSAPSVDVLILLPPGFPDVGPDMFYTLPWVQLVPEGKYPKAADQPYDFNGQRWQRWSRHSNEWRPGRDGIQTVMKRVAHSFEVAQP